MLFSLIDADQLIGGLFLIMISAISVFYYLRVIKVIYFESKNLKLNAYQFKTVYSTGLFSFDCMIIASLLFVLLILFFYPSPLLLICQYLVINSFWF